MAALLALEGVSKSFGALRVTDNVTLALSIEDEVGYEIFTSGAKARNANYNLKATDLDQSVLIAGTFRFKATLSGDAGGEGGSAKAVILYWGIKG